VVRFGRTTLLLAQDRHFKATRAATPFDGAKKPLTRLVET
jgi:hypothetical protein